MAGKKEENKKSEKNIPENSKKQQKGKTKDEETFLTVGFYLIIAFLMFMKFIMDSIKWIAENLSKLFNGSIEFFKEELNKK